MEAIRYDLFSTHIDSKNQMRVRCFPSISPLHLLPLSLHHLWMIELAFNSIIKSNRLHLGAHPLPCRIESQFLKETDNTKELSPYQMLEKSEIYLINTYCSYTARMFSFGM